MVVKAKSSDVITSSDPLRGVQSGSIGKENSTEVEFSRLKKLVPAISTKQSVSKLDVILEAIRYIDELQDQLIDQIRDNKLSLSAASLLVGKENTESSILKKLEERRKEKDVGQ